METISLKEDLELLETFFFISENDKPSNEKIKRIKAGINIIDKKIKNTNHSGKKYLENQKKLLEVKQKEEEDKESQRQKDREEVLNQIHNKNVDKLISKHVKYDKHNVVHNSIIKDYHRQQMERARSFKNNNSDDQEEQQPVIVRKVVQVPEKIPASVQAALINKQKQTEVMNAKQKIINSQIAQKNAAVNIKANTTKMIQNSQ